MNVTFRQVEEKDNPALANLIRQVFDEHDAPKTGTIYAHPTTDNLYELFQTAGAVLIIAEADDKIIGCCGIYPSAELPEDYAELVKFYVTKEARGEGVGRTLMEKCIDLAVIYEYTHLYLESLPEYSKAVAMYEKEGFVKLNKPLGKFEFQSCSIWMLKKLN
ncbi:MAG: GNAT family N-acetyltransferase [bacterium]